MATIGVLHFTCPPIVGGVESLIALHSRLLLGRGYRVRAVAGRGTRFHPDVPLDLIPAVDSKYAPLLAVNDELKAGLVGPRFDALADELTERLRVALRGLDACIVHNAPTLHFNLPLTVALRRLVDAGGPRLIAWCHDLSWTNPLYVPLMREREPWTLLKARWPGVSYVVVSEDRRVDLLRLWGAGPRPGEDPTVIPAGVDPAAKLRLRRATVALARQLRLERAWPFMLLPARITKRKNIEYAIRVTRALRDRGLRPILLVTGPPGPHNVRSVDYVDELQAERLALGVESEVVFLHEQRRADGRPWRATDPMMDDLYQLADLLLFPSAQEGFGIPLLEAGLVRLPVFCSDIPSFREIAGDMAHVFRLDDPPGHVAERIATYLETDPSAGLRRRVLDTFTWEQIFAERIEPIVAAAVARGPGRSRRGEPAARPLLPDGAGEGEPAARPYTDYTDTESPGQADADRRAVRASRS